MSQSKERKVWTESEIKAMLEKSDKAVRRGIVAIYKLQTSDEQRSGTTSHSNGVGFNAYDANSGTFFAKLILDGTEIYGKYLYRARKLTLKYRRQLTAIANNEL